MQHRAGAGSGGGVRPGFSLTYEELHEVSCAGLTQRQPSRARRPHEERPGERRGHAKPTPNIFGVGLCCPRGSRRAPHPPPPALFFRRVRGDARQGKRGSETGGVRSAHRKPPEVDPRGANPARPARARLVFPGFPKSKICCGWVGTMKVGSLTGFTPALVRGRRVARATLTEPAGTGAAGSRRVCALKRKRKRKSTRVRKRMRERKRKRTRVRKRMRVRKRKRMRKWKWKRTRERKRVRNKTRGRGRGSGSGGGRG